MIASLGSKRVDDTSWTLYPDVIRVVWDTSPNLLEILVASNNRVFLFVLFRYVLRSASIVCIGLLSRHSSM